MRRGRPSRQVIWTGLSEQVIRARLNRQEKWAGLNMGEAVRAKWADEVVLDLALDQTEQEQQWAGLSWVNDDEPSKRRRKKLWNAQLDNGSGDPSENGMQRE